MNFSVNLFAGWTGFLAGAVSGAVLGLFFYREDWLGGYSSFSRRMLRLGHIACFGLGLINILFALTAATLPPSRWLHPGSIALVIGLIAMPSVCFLSAWRHALRRLFFIPVAATSIGILALLVSFPLP